MYSYQRFGAIVLPTFNRVSGMSPVPPLSRLVQTMAGAFDGDGAGRSSRRFPHELALRCVVAEGTTSGQRAALDALRAAVGQRNYLYRMAEDDGTVQRALCRLTGLDVERSTRDRASQEVTLQFSQLAGWTGAKRGEAWTFDSGIFFDTTYVLDAGGLTFSLTLPSQVVSVTNGGNLPATDVKITVQVLTGTISGITISGAGWQFTITRSMPAGTVLVIDAGAQMVTVGGVNAYGNFALGAGHTIEDWARMEPGANSVTVAYSGTATANINFALAEGWA